MTAGLLPARAKIWYTIEKTHMLFRHPNHRGFRFLFREARLVFKVGTPGSKNNEDLDALESFTDALESKDAAKTMEGAGKFLNRQRSHLVEAMDRASERGFLGTIIPGYQSRRAKKIMSEEIDRIATDIVLEQRHSDLLPGRIKQFLFGPNYMPPKLLAKVKQTSAEIAETFAKEMQGEAASELSDDQLLSRAENVLEAKNVKLTFSKAHTVAVDALKNVGKDARAAAGKNRELMNPVFESLQQKEDLLRGRLLDKGVIEPGPEADELFDKNRNRKSDLINRISSAKIPGFLKELFLADARSLQSERFSRDMKRHYDTVNTKFDVLNVASLKQRLDAFATMPEATIRSGRIQVTANLRSYGESTLSVVGREDGYLRLTMKTPKGKVAAVVNLQTGVVTPRLLGPKGMIGPKSQLTENMFHILA